MYDILYKIVYISTSTYLHNHSILNNNWYNTILRRISTRPKTYDRIFHHILKKNKTQKMYWKKIHQFLLQVAFMVLAGTKIVFVTMVSTFPIFKLMEAKLIACLVQEMKNRTQKQLISILCVIVYRRYIFSKTDME